jgi:hypothetical protein
LMTALFTEDAGTRDSTMNVDYPQQYGVQGFTELLAQPDKLVLVAEVAVPRPAPLVRDVAGVRRGPDQRRSRLLGHSRPSTTLDLYTHYQRTLDPRVWDLFAEFRNGRRVRRG